LVAQYQTQIGRRIEQQIESRYNKSMSKIRGVQKQVHRDDIQSEQINNNKLIQDATRQTDWTIERT
jgi:hypothetical protein